VNNCMRINAFWKDFNLPEAFRHILSLCISVKTVVAQGLKSA